MKSDNDYWYIHMLHLPLLHLHHHPTVDFKNSKKICLPPKKNSPAKKKNQTKYFFSISISPKNKKIDLKISKKCNTPPKKIPLPPKKFQKIIFSQFQFRLKIKKMYLKNFKKTCSTPKKIPPPPQKISNKYLFSI